MTPALLVFFAGLAGSMHCIGMCGGFACALGADPRGAAATTRRHLAYNLGRISSYVFLGAIVGHLGGQIMGPGGMAQRGLALVSGGLMVLIGLQFIGVLRHARPLNAGALLLATPLRSLLAAPGAGAPLALGVLNGWLPCPLVYAFAAQAAVGGSALAGAQTMAAFGLGTLAAMLAVGGMAAWQRGRAAANDDVATIALPGRPGRSGRSGLAGGARWRLHAVQLAGTFVLLLGVITFARGAVPTGAEWLIAICTSR